MKQNRKRFPTGVVHSFTGDMKSLNEIMELDLFIGLNINEVLTNYLSLTQESMDVH